MPAPAHIGGVPVEELLAAVPAAGAATGLALAWIRARVGRARARRRARAARSGVATVRVLPPSA